jgi:ABC-type glutathione transport system ATPase component
MAEEIQTDCIKKCDDNKCRHAIKVTNGNFFWSNMNDQKQETQKEETDNKKKENTTKPSKLVTGLELTSVAEIDKQPLLNGFQESVQETSTSVPILKNINLEIKKGAFVAILGEYVPFIYRKLID